jgi:hypothetical protein
MQLLLQVKDSLASTPSSCQRRLTQRVDVLRDDRFPATIKLSASPALLEGLDDTPIVYILSINYVFYPPQELQVLSRPVRSRTINLS